MIVTRTFPSGDQTATQGSAVWLELADRRMSIEYYSDLLEDFLETINRMEGEYRRAASGRNKTTSTQDAE
ncbi:hypothetical protein SGFS_062430 [Streptomyces graminofaciens]|uniref:Uncharacterized protein n=1 Tax=Streptomyces graminofaciens TaxID=68212 RepID=A0ABN5VNP4_9ACTN|nr:hypothetical protein [Streptomyces graminofaciens]BBC34949.1 hypothetical protein SGFS_062430 [Streptomyces graminofaciens]